jgi:hypothetical protein
MNYKLVLGILLLIIVVVTALRGYRPLSNFAFNPLGTRHRGILVAKLLIIEVALLIWSVKLIMDGLK